MTSSYLVRGCVGTVPGLGKADSSRLDGTVPAPGECDTCDLFYAAPDKSRLMHGAAVSAHLAQAHGYRPDRPMVAAS